MATSDPGPRTEIPHSTHPAPAGSKALRPTNPAAQIQLTLGVKRKKDLPDLSAIEMKQPGQRTYMTREVLARDYGSDEAALARIRAFAQAHNMTILKEEPGAARLTLTGSVEDVTAAFGVKLLDYDHPQMGRFHARVGSISVPSTIQPGDITGVFGFNNNRAIRRAPRKSPQQANARSKGSSAFSPDQLSKIYDFPDADLSQQTIGLLEFGGGVNQADVTAYFQQMGVAAPAITIVSVDGASTDPKADPDSTMEVMLDVEVAGAMAPGAGLVVYFSSFDEKGVIDALAAVVADSKNNPGVVSVSWGWDENQPFNNQTLWSPTAMDHVNHSLLAAAQLGITICVSTGDDGSEAQIPDGHAHVNFPATSPYVLAVGGTTLHVHNAAGGATVVQERVWNNGPEGGGTGGGVSDFTPMPTWQEGVVPTSINPGHFAGRAIPDVAANADPSTGYKVLINGQSTVVGGTSASAPLWACLLTRMNASLGVRVGNFNALLYAKYGPAGVLRDITVGNNDTRGLLSGNFPARPGWDAATGWGVPVGSKLLDALKAPS